MQDIKIQAGKGVLGRDYQLVFNEYFLIKN